MRLDKALGKEISSFKGKGPGGDNIVALFFSPESVKEQQNKYSQPCTVQPDEGDYCARCFAKNYLEEDEARSWVSDPAFRRVLDPLNAGDNARARKEAEALLLNFPDFAGLYVWGAKSFLNEQNYQEARRVLWEGLSKSKQKYPLLNLMGEVEWKSGALSEAVYWWIQGLICQQTRQRFGEEVGAYLYLSYVADTLGLLPLAEQLCHRVDFIRPWQIRLSPDAASNLAGLVRRSDTSQIRKALGMLEKKYFKPESRTEKTPSQDDEVAALIRIAQDTDAGYEARGEAIQKLAEIGNSRAIGPLMQIYNTELHLIRLDALDAVEKIRARGK